MKKLYRSTDDKMLAGVLGGFAEYINADPTIVRLVYVLLAIISCGAFITFYVICCFVIPKKPIHTDTAATSHTENHAHDHVSHETTEPEKADDTETSI